MNHARPPHELRNREGNTLTFGHFAASGRAVLGAPPRAPKLRYPHELAARHGVPSYDWSVVSSKVETDVKVLARRPRAARERARR